MTFDQTQPAVQRLNRQFVNDFQEWTKRYKPEARYARKKISFDFEEFRMIALYCYEKQRAIVRKNCGFGETQLSKLRVEFVKHTVEGSSSEVDAAGLMKLLKAAVPESQTSAPIHDRLRRAVDKECETTKSGIDWYGFLRIMMDFHEETEFTFEQCVQEVIKGLNLTEATIDRGQEILRRCCRGDKAEPPVTPADIQFLVKGLAPCLSVEEAEKVIEIMQSNEFVQGELMGVRNLRKIVTTSDLSANRRHARSHDLPSGTL